MFYNNSLLNSHCNTPSHAEPVLAINDSSAKFISENTTSKNKRSIVTEDQSATDGNVVCAII